jgi:hypothetical protein
VDWNRDILKLRQRVAILANLVVFKINAFCTYICYRFFNIKSIGFPDKTNQEAHNTLYEYGKLESFNPKQNTIAVNPKTPLYTVLLSP